MSAALNPTAAFTLPPRHNLGMCSELYLSFNENPDPNRVYIGQDYTCMRTLTLIASLVITLIPAIPNPTLAWGPYGAPLCCVPTSLE